MTDSLSYFWQHLPEKMNPIAFSFGNWEINWYALMYLAAFLVIYLLVKHRIKDEKLDISLEAVKEFLPWGIAGLLIGARLADVFIYDWGYFKNHPLEIFLPFDPYSNWKYIGIYGMSYFGGLTGLVLSFHIFCKFKKINLLKFSDLFAPAVPAAYTFGRLGNFINGELYGRITNTFWGMYFPLDLTHQLRHPSQLYEAFFEGIVLFLILWSIRKKSFPIGYLTAFYLIGYGIARFFIEFLREPDESLGFIIDSLTLGQILCALMALGGLFILSRKRSGLKEQIPFNN